MSEKKSIESIAAKVRNLLNKTVENGATEAEALAAAEKARRMLDKYDLSLSQVEVEQSDFVQTHVAVGRRDHFHLIADAIQHFCDCKCWLSSRDGDPLYRLVFLGMKHDTEMATHLFSTLLATRNREYDFFKKGDEYAHLRNRGVGGLAIKNSFTRGFVFRVSERLRLAKEDLQPTETGRSLVPVKMKAAEAEMDRLGIAPEEGGRLGGEHVGAAIRKGHEAGARASLNRPVENGPQAAALI